MACYRPLSAWRRRDRFGKWTVSLREPGLRDLMMEPFGLPCGRCVGCRLDRSKQWAVRCVHEASMYERNCFVTLTYADEYLPRGGTLEKSAPQKFFKRLRKRYGKGVRYYMAGEYGDNFGRPHYHCLLFNHDFDDKYLWRVSERGDRIYRSESLERLWPFGMCEIGDVTFHSAAYVARYILKKVLGTDADAHYSGVDIETGEYLPRTPEYTAMSRRPGIGKTWFEKYSRDVYPFDEVVVQGRKLKPPRYYDIQFELLSPCELEIIKTRREENARRRNKDCTPERLKVRERVQSEKLKLFSRRKLK